VSGDQSVAADQAFAQNSALSDQTYKLGSEAMGGGLSYLTNSYKTGGYDQSAKYSAMQSQAMDKTAGGPAAARAQALAGVTAQKVTSGLDEMSKIRSMLSGQGLQTTGLAEQAAGQSVSALNGMYQGNQALETVKGVGALGSSIYGAGKQGGWWGGASGQNASIGGAPNNPATGGKMTF
jgi:hypothetical protein